MFKSYLLLSPFVILIAQGNAGSPADPRNIGRRGSSQVQEEESLVRRAQKHDEAAITMLYETHFDRIYRYVALKIGDRTEAEDITQQVFLNAIKSISSYSCKGSPFSAWLFRIAHNQIVDYFRKRSKQKTVPLEDFHADCAASTDPRAIAYLNLDLEMLTSATRKLTKAQQEVIALRFSGGLSINEAAKAMGKSEGAIKALQHSAVLSLRKILAPEQPV